jgi:type VI protein secretion system component VasK
MTTPTDLPMEPSAGHPPPPRAERASGRALAWPIILVVVVIGVLLFLIGDLRFDLAQGVPFSHIAEELAFVALLLVGVIGTIVQLRAALRHMRELQRDRSTSREDAERWRSEAEALARRVGAAVDEHFSEWGLTSAEKEIALLVLRGL